MTQRQLDIAQSADPIRDALARFVGSRSMAGSERLRDFVTYITEESLAGRGAEIRGKRIAQDVYPGAGARGEGRDNLVRVDAGRLRRKLADYYAADGAADPVRIHLDKGGYAPWFEAVASADAPAPTAHPRPRWPWPLALLLLAGLAAGWALWPEREPAIAPPRESDARVAQRLALLAKSPATLQAANLCEIGRGLLFPIAEKGTQAAAQATFRNAIATDPDYGCGYAGLAHSLATSSLLLPEGPDQAALVQAALQAAERAVALSPTEGWHQSALAWAAFAAGDHARALEQSALAEKLDPEDGNLLDFRAMTLVLSGEFAAAYRLSSDAQPRLLGSDRFAYRNIHAVAAFHLGRYGEAIAAIKRASAEGQPVSALSLVYLAAAAAAAEERSTAQRAAAQLMALDPPFPVAAALGRFYTDPADLDALLTQLQRAGWQP